MGNSFKVYLKIKKHELHTNTIFADLRKSERRKTEIESAYVLALLVAGFRNTKNPRNATYRRLSHALLAVALRQAAAQQVQTASFSLGRPFIQLLARSSCCVCFFCGSFVYNFLRFFGKNQANICVNRFAGRFRRNITELCAK